MTVAGELSRSDERSLLDAMNTDINQDENLTFEHEMRRREIVLAEQRLEHEMRPIPKWAMVSNLRFLRLTSAGAKRPRIIRTWVLSRRIMRRGFLTANIQSLSWL